MSIRLTFIILLAGTISTPAFAEGGRFDSPKIKRSPLKFRLGPTEPAPTKKSGILSLIERTIPQTRQQPAQREPQRAAKGVANPLGFAYVPLPRRKPLRGQPLQNRNQNRVADGQPLPVVQTKRNGEVNIVLDRLQRERNQASARNLRPTLKTSWSKAQIKSAVDRCKLVLATTNIGGEILPPIGGSGGCGIAAPLLITSFGAVKVKPAAKLNCNMALATYKWLIDDVQPMARRKYKSPVIAIRQLSSYSCRSRRGSGTSRISEHSFGNALDVGGFTFANGTKLTLLKNWSTASALFGIGRDANFLFDAHKYACKNYATVLSPRYNKAHANHFHMDMGRSGRYKICK